VVKKLTINRFLQHLIETIQSDYLHSKIKTNCKDKIPTNRWRWCSNLGEYFLKCRNSSKKSIKCIACKCVFAWGTVLALDWYKSVKENLKTENGLKI